jgi:thioredoxin 2
MSSETTTCPSCGAKNRIAPSATGVPHCAKCSAALPWLVDVHDDDFASVVAESSLPVLIDLWAPWCPPCRMVGPLVEASATQFAGRLKVAKLNVDESPRTADGFGVKGIPTLIMMQGGKEIGRQVGALLGDALPRWIEKTIPTEAVA